MFESDGSLHWHYDGEHLQIQPWGPNAFRVRSTKLAKMPEANWALSEPVPSLHAEVTVPPHQQVLTAPDISDHGIAMDLPPASITNGRIKATVSAYGKLSVVDVISEQQVLEEYNRTKIDHRDPKASAIEVKSREYLDHGSGSTEYRITYRFESQSTSEKIYGMGQYQQPYLNLKGHDLELAQRNSQVTVPFFYSSLNYGFLWNNPSLGRACLGNNVMSFEASSSNAIDFWIVVGESPKKILRSYADVTGHAPMMPEYGLGFWQSKLRYKNQEKLLEVAREYKRRSLPIDVIVADYFHWAIQGDWSWDSTAWPDPKAMVEELENMGIKLLVSVWPTVDKRCDAYSEMRERGLLVRVDRGIHTSRDFLGQCLHADFTNPVTRAYVWKKIKDNYFAHGINCFWLDEAEPEFNGNAVQNYRYYLGPAMSVGNIYPLEFSKAFFDGQMQELKFDHNVGVVNLVRSAWAGSQKYGALVWSGDIISSWKALQNQLCAGLSMGMSGIPWWTTDIGGFYGGVTADPNFQELLVRWFQWGTFLPVMRLHGCREPVSVPEAEDGGVARCATGADNEIWSFGDDNYAILAKFLRFRERQRPYIRRLMHEATVAGTPLMRTMFCEFPDDPLCWEQETQYMFGDRYLCAPILGPGMTDRTVYLPKNSRWSRLVINSDSDHVEGAYEGGSSIKVQCPIDTFPAFVRMDLVD